jgi:hypothetical protein
MNAKYFYLVLLFITYVGQIFITVGFVRVFRPYGSIRKERLWIITGLVLQVFSAVVFVWNLFNPVFK